MILGADVRNTRIAVHASSAAMSGPKLGGSIEIDFFGGYNGSSAFSDEQPLPRLRLAYADLVWSRTSVRIGQAFTPIAGVVPSSPTHVAFPLGFGSAGWIGWRHPGVFVTHQFTGGAQGDMKLSGQVGAFRGSWSGPGNVLDAGSAGEAGSPQFEGRLELASGTRWSAFVAGHWDRKDISAAGVDSTSSVDGSAVTVGGRTAVGVFTVQGGGYVGRAIGQQMGMLTQFGDIGGRGGWLQAGVTFRPGWSAWLFRGVDDPDDADVLREVAGNARLRNDLAALSVQYSPGPWTAGMEWTRASTRWAADGAGDSRNSANQLTFSLIYRFSTDAPPAVAAADDRTSVTRTSGTGKKLP
jgi:hypothetical protein